MTKQQTLITGLFLLFLSSLFISCERNRPVQTEKDVTLNNVASYTKLPTLNAKSKTDELTTFKVETMHFPLPSKYRYSISSPQGLRDSISDVGVGGAATISQYHNAIDFSVPVRTPVYAAKSGTVVNVYPGYDNGKQWKGHPTYGGMIEIRHNDNTRTLYAHLIRTDVTEGETVTKGQLIGGTGGAKGQRASGQSTGPHLHFAVYLDIQYAFDITES